MIDMDEWADYYTNPDNVAKIAEACRYKEIVIIRNVNGQRIVVRPCKVYLPQHLIYWIERLNLRRTLFDIYHSVASVKLPRLTPNLSEMKKDREYLNEHWAELINAYDLFVDVDIDEVGQRMYAEKYARDIVKELKEKGYKKTQLWDTSRGYHCIDAGKFDPIFVKNLVMDICCELDIPMSMPVKEIDGARYKAQDGKWVKMKPDEQPLMVNKPYVDLGIYDIRRISRVQYSLHSKTGKPMRRIL